jgi:Rps23 Pro-64 3,4-dihydroxylase Tpa1-like proline 4-hydroxylase
MTNLFTPDLNKLDNDSYDISNISRKFLSYDAKEIYQNFDHFVNDQQDIGEIKEILNNFNQNWTISEEGGCKEIINILKVSSFSNESMATVKFSENKKRKQINLKGNILINSISEHSSNCDSTYLNSHESFSKFSLPSTPERVKSNFTKRNASCYYSHEEN